MFQDHCANVVPDYFYLLHKTFALKCDSFVHQEEPRGSWGGWEAWGHMRAKGDKGLPNKDQEGQ